MELTDRQRAELQKIRYLGYDHYFKPIFSQFHLEAPENLAAFGEFIVATNNEALVAALCAKVESLEEVGKPSITLFGCAPVHFVIDEVLEKIQGEIGPRKLLQIDNLHKTEYAVRSVRSVGESLYVTVAFEAPPVVYQTWDESTTVTPVNEMVVRYQPGAYYVAMVGRERYSKEIARDLSSRFDLPIPNDIVVPNKRWFTNILEGIPDITVRSMAGHTDHRIARRFALGAGQLEDIRHATGNKIDDLRLEVEGNRTTGKVSLLRVAVRINGRVVTIALNLENDKIVVYNYLDFEMVEAVLNVLQQVLLAEGAA